MTRRRELLRRLAALSGAGAMPTLAGCITVAVGEEAQNRVQLALHDPGSPPTPLPRPLVDALLIQPLPGSALADTTAIAYARAPRQYAFYQYASWADRPLRALPRLLQQRLEARGLAGVSALAGDPQRADWLLALAVDDLHHAVAAGPGSGRVAITAELFDRRARQRVARRRFDAEVPAARADSAAAAAAMSAATAQAFDALLPWLEAALAAAAGGAPRGG